MKGFRTAMTVIGAPVALGIVGTAVAPVAAIAAPAVRAAVVAGAVPDAWVEVSNGTHFRVMVGDHNVAPTRVDVRPVGSEVVVATLDKFWYESDTVGSEEPDIGWYEAHDELRLDGMGDYELDVYVLSDGGGVAARKGAGRSTYALDPKLDVASDQKQFSLGLTVRYRAEPAFRGAITRVTDDGRTVAAAGRIVRAEPAQPGGSAASSRSGADGTFAVNPRVTAAGSWKVSGQDPWLVKTPAQTATVAKVTHTTDVTEEKVVSTDQYLKMTISGKIVVDGVTTQKAPVEIQTKVGGGQWVTQQTLTVDYNKTFTTTVEASTEFPPSPWRIYTPGTQNIGPSTGAELQPGRLQTRFEPTGGTVWQELGSSNTRADGTFGAKFKAVSDGTWRVRHVDTGAQHFASTSHTVYLDVRGGTAPCAAE